mgnify:CR=1 FL=1
MSYEITNEEIETFISQNWDEFIADAERLIAIDSSLDKQHACNGAPFGPGPRRALDEMLGIAKRLVMVMPDMPILLDKAGSSLV